MENIKLNIPSGLTVIYYCAECPGIYTKESSCPTCNTENKSIGWVEKE